MTIYVIHMGELYSMSVKNYRQMLELIAADNCVEWSITDYGKSLGIVTNITDMAPEHATAELKRYQ